MSDTKASDVLDLVLVGLIERRRSEIEYINIIREAIENGVPPEQLDFSFFDDKIKDNTDAIKRRVKGG